MQTGNINQEILLTMFQEVKEMFKENARQLEESRKERERIEKESRKERERIEKESRKERERIEKESRERMERLERESRERMERLERESRERMERMSKETDQKINKMSGIFSSRWGKLMEALVEPACLKLFKARNIDVSRTQTNVKIKRSQIEAEFDIVLVNGTEVVVVEVKTDMSVDKVNYFLEKLSHIKTYIPEYKDKKIYGAVAGIKYSEQSDKYAYRRGLFVLRNSGDYVIEIANSEKFKPKSFG